MDRPSICFVLHQPGESTWKRIALAARAGYRVLVYDNSPSRAPAWCLAACSESLRYIQTGDNVGIARALRELTFEAVNEGWRTMLYFDQDTVFTEETLEFAARFAALSSRDTELMEEARVFSVTFSANRRRRRPRGMIELDGYTLHIVDFAISSGTLFFLDKLVRIGGHDPRYFVDGVDYSICLEAEKHGQHMTVLYGAPGLDHHAEQDDHTWRLLGQHFVARKYPANRIQDYVRSSIRLIAVSLSMGSRKSLLLVRFLLVYLTLQLLVRFAHQET